MAERVFVHVGAPKTGTTYLQDTLWLNRDALRGDGVLVPGGRRFAAFHAAQAIRDVARLAELPPGRRDVWADMQRRIGDWPDKAVLSHEFLGAATADQAVRAIEALRPAEVHVVLTARDYVAAMPALWQETVKMGAQRSLEGYTSAVMADKKAGPWGRASVDVVGILDRWGSTLPPDRVHVVTVPPAGSAPDLLWTRFAQVCGLDPARYSPPPRPANASLSAVRADLLQMVAQHLPDDLAPMTLRHRWLRGYLAQEVLARSAGPRRSLAPSTAARVRAWSEQTVVTLGQRGYDVVGSLDELISAPLPGEDDAVDVSDADVLAAAAETIGELLDRHRLLTAELESVRQQVMRRTQPPEQASSANTGSMAPAGRMARLRRAARRVARLS
jgi:hypothetical protein